MSVLSKLRSLLSRKEDGYGFAGRGIPLSEKTSELPATVPYGVSYSGPTEAPYSPLASMEAFSAFPWLVACLNRLSEDMSGLPLVFYVKIKGKYEKASDTETEYLFENPNQIDTGETFRRQFLIELLLTGTQFMVPSGYGKRVSSLRNLSPERVLIVPDDNEGISGFRYERDNGSITFHRDQVVYTRLPGFGQGGQALYGQGYIRPLHGTLSTEFYAQKMAQKTAKTGRPDVLLTPAEGSAPLTPELRKAIVKEYNKLMAEGGALVVDRRLKVDLLNPVLRDMEFKELRAHNKNTIEALTGVPPAKLAEDTTNFAVAKEQEKVYWTKLQADSRLVSAAFTKVARREDPRLVVRHDLSEVPALQESRSERLNRVSVHIINGMKAEDAYKYEGFQDIPSLQETEKEHAATDAAKSIADLLFPVSPAALLCRASDGPTSAQDFRAALKLAVRTAKPSRGDIWQSMITRMHAPQEKKIARKARAYLSAASNRYAARLEAELENAGYTVTKTKVTVYGSESFPFFGEKNTGVTDELIAAICSDSSERAELKKALLSVFVETSKFSFENSVTDLPEEVRFSNNDIETLFDEFSSQLLSSTKKDILTLVENAAKEGLSIAEMRAALESSSLFSADRALRVSRTETTKMLSEGTRQAIEGSANLGFDVKKMWVSARDANVRQEHTDLDGESVSSGANFQIKSGSFSGATAIGPGMFRQVALNVNCRCVLIADIGD